MWACAHLEIGGQPHEGANFWFLFLDFAYGVCCQCVLAIAFFFFLYELEC